MARFEFANKTKETKSIGTIFQELSTFETSYTPKTGTVVEYSRRKMSMELDKHRLISQAKHPAGFPNYNARVMV